MILKQTYLGCLAHASYFIADEGSRLAAVVDPQRDIEVYLEEARRGGFTIRYAILTHFHADFLAGHLELRESTGAEICLGSRAQAEYKFRPLEDGEELSMGLVRLKALHTPGHTPESISIAVFDGSSTDTPAAVLTGDTLFIGDVGRPDLRASLGWRADRLGGMLYDSLHQKLMTLPDSTLVYPAHGAGSLCGKALSRETVSTIGAQRHSNYALQPMGRDEFLNIVLADQPDAPEYFTYDAVLNTRERATLTKSLDENLRPLAVAEVVRERAKWQILDTRPALAFSYGHMRGALQIGLDGQFATWCGSLLDHERPIVLIAEPDREREAAVRLGRIGFDRIAGYLAGGMEALQPFPEMMDAFARISPSVLAAALDSNAPPAVLDVRTDAEHAKGAIPNAMHVPLQRLSARRDEVPTERPVVTYCQGGYRSCIAASLLQGWGIEPLDLEGGYPAWRSLGGN